MRTEPKFTSDKQRPRTSLAIGEFSYYQNALGYIYPLTTLILLEELYPIERIFKLSKSDQEFNSLQFNDPDVIKHMDRIVNSISCSDKRIDRVKASLTLFPFALSFTREEKLYDFLNTRNPNNAIIYTNNCDIEFLTFTNCYPLTVLEAFGLKCEYINSSDSRVTKDIVIEDNYRQAMSA